MRKPSESLAMIAGLLPGAWFETTDAKPSSRVVGEHALDQRAVDAAPAELGMHRGVRGRVGVAVDLLAAVHGDDALAVAHEPAIDERLAAARARQALGLALALRAAREVQLGREAFAAEGRLPGRPVAGVVGDGLDAIAAGQRRDGALEHGLRPGPARRSRPLRNRAVPEHALRERLPAVDRERLAGDVRGVVGEQEERARDDVLERREAAVGDVARASSRGSPASGTAARPRPRCRAARARCS